MMSATRYYRDCEGAEMLDSPGQLYLMRLMTNDQFVSEPVFVTVRENDLKRWSKVMGDRVITNLIPEGDVEEPFFHKIGFTRHDRELRLRYNK